MIIKDLKAAKKYLPSVVQKGDNIDIADSFNLAEQQLVDDIIGEELYAELLKKNEVDAKLLVMCERIISINGFLAAIPEIDLVLTQSGFGVINENDGYVPASSARVKAMIASQTDRSDSSTDTLIRFLIASEQYQDIWRSTEQFTSITSGLIPSYAEFKDYAPFSPLVSANYPKSYSEFKKLYSPMNIALLTEVASYLSRDYCVELVERYRDNEIITLHEKFVLTQIRHAICSLVLGDEQGGRNFIIKARSYMLKFPAAFPTFTDSPESKTVDIERSETGIFSTL